MDLVCLKIKHETGGCKKEEYEQLLAYIEELEKIAGKEPTDLCVVPKREECGQLFDIIEKLQKEIKEKDPVN